MHNLVPWSALLLLLSAFSKAVLAEDTATITGVSSSNLTRGESKWGYGDTARNPDSLSSSSMDAQSSQIPPSVLRRIKEAVGPRGWIADPHRMEPYLIEQRGYYKGWTPMVVCPASTREVSEVVRVCSEAGVGIVPQGGNTGLVGGAVLDELGNQILLSLSRMNRIRELDPLNFTATVEAGCVLATVQATAEMAGLLFPLSLGAEGTCQIGGNLSTNAGGTAVLRYGNARDLVLGLEVVLANGEVLQGLRRLRKDNSGYDLKQLFLGSEGTLGIITAAVLKLFPKPRQVQTTILAVPNPAAATRLLARFREDGGDVVTAFEYMDHMSLELVLKHIPATRNPLTGRHEHYVLVELSSSRADDDLRGFLQATLANAYKAGDVVDAAIAVNGAQAAELWRLRETIPEAERRDGAGIKHDVSVPVSRVPEFLDLARKAVDTELPEALVVAFGHLGDGNIHFNLNQPQSMSKDTFLSHAPSLNRLIHDLAVRLEGSFSAEHGIGRRKRDELQMSFNSISPQ